MWEGRGAHCRNWEDNGLRRLSYPNMLLLIRGVAILHLTLAIKTASNSCPHPCSCSHDTVICTGQGLLRIPSRIPPDTVRLYVSFSLHFFLLITITCPVNLDV
ncbi:unnamed protein product [Onchocerca flexuosa]|uniref:LRRNT domain-containing protein n=1 Tax=Onchocerca flexuosa TaxID=387005 RepID=A0A183I2P8_9BILA|nr:unnamed protein product [Onchocerca flexuosa]